jgi:HSF-type DNA-binding
MPYTGLILNTGKETSAMRSHGHFSKSEASTKEYVEHNYTDHYCSPVHRPFEDSNNVRRGPRGGVLVPFPEKLYDMLNQMSAEGLDDVVSWQPHGRAFVVHQPERFVEEVMPR